jgi:hypothetical protein
MDALATRGHVILDDDQVRLRTGTASAQRFTQLFALKADESSVSSRFSDRPTASEVTAEITAAINALKGNAPALLDTLDEIANALNDDHDVYNTLLALINAKNPLLSVPSANGVTLLKNNDMRRLEVTGNATITDNSNRVTLNVSGVSAAAFASHQTSVATSLGQKQNTLSSGGGTGVHILDTANNVVKRIRLYGNVNTTSDSNEVVVHVQGRTDSQVDALLNAKQNTLSNNSGSTGEQLLTGTTLRKIRAGSNITLSLVDGDLSISSSGGVTASDVATSIAAAVSAYTLTSTLTTQLAAKQDVLSSAGGTGNAILASNVIKRIDFDGDFAISDNGSKISVSLQSALSTKQDTLSNYSVNGFELFSSNKLKRIQVPINLSLGAPLVMSETTTGQLELISTSYSSSMTDTLLAAKQAELTVSAVSGSSLLNGTILKRIAVSGTGLSIADSGHALTLTQDLSSKQDALTIPASASGTPCLDLSSGRTTVRKFQTSGDSIISMSTINSGETIDIAADGYTKSQISNFLAAKQDTITNGTSAIPLLVSGVLRTLSFSGAIAYAFSNYNTEIAINVPAYTTTQSDARYVQVDPSEFKVVNSNGPNTELNARTTRTDITYGGGGFLRIRREDGSGNTYTKADFPDNQSGPVNFPDGISQNSDSRLKDNQQAMSTQDAFDILTAVEAKTYTRNDQANAPKFGFIAQEMEAAIAGKANFECLVGSTVGDSEEEPCMKTLDYSRLTAILWTTCRSLHNRLTALETANASA